MVGVVVLAAVQVGAFAMYRWFAPHDDPATAIAYEQVDAGLSRLVLERPGASLATDTLDQPVVLHFWATWCAPCREELPRFLALDQPRPDEAMLLAVSLDENWEVVAHYFDDDVPANVWRLRSGSGLPFKVKLPETWLVQDGRVISRARGTQLWTAQALMAWADLAAR